MSYRTKKQKVKASQKFQIEESSTQSAKQTTSSHKVTLPPARKYPESSFERPTATTNDLFGYDIRLIYQDLTKTAVITIFIIGILLFITQKM